ncbi:hypothetical protein FRC07_015078 [Ceratobasidium sp. 392]|nr:hypothetical protein FRC07_015078 [Ceratobasidium sp. 392]
MVMSASFRRITHSILFDTSGSQSQLRKRRAIILAAYTALLHLQTVQNKSKRHPYRKSLVRANLLPNPRFQTSWQQLYHSQSDGAYITTMGVDVATFRFLMTAGFRECWETNPISREDVHAQANP